MEVLGSTTLLVYADQIVIFRESRTDLEETVKKLKVTSKNIGLKINENNTKYMLMSRYPAPFQNLNVHQFFFEQTEKFNYLSANKKS